MTDTAQRQKLIIINNLPTPYRIHFFNTVHDEMTVRGMAFEAWFMAKTERGRYWPFEPSGWRFKGRVFPGLHPYMRGIAMHTNPLMWWTVRRDPPTWVLLAGGWHLPTSLGIRLVHAPRTSFLLWAEANMHAARFSKGLPDQYRRWMMNSADGFVIPGEIARLTITEKWQITGKSMIVLPNLVDETVFRDSSLAFAEKRSALRAQYQVSDEKRVLFWSARLSDATKGLINFLDAVDGLPLTILIAGEGKDRPLVETWIATHPMMDVRLLGHQPQAILVEYLTIADAAILPSFRDPNPLANIEALWAGLPLLTSIYCGNYLDVIEEGQNGWVVDPADKSALRAAVERIIATPAEMLRGMGQRSRALAERRFSTTKATAAFVDDLLALRQES